jgi:hypothetical protein
MDPQFPIGPFDPDRPRTPADRPAMIATIAALPAALREALAGRSEADLERRYREGGWTVRQVVHHLADSHMNGFIRFKLALTEDLPVIRPYRQSPWGALPDAAQGPVEDSLLLLEGLHARWVTLMEAMDAGQWTQRYVHPEQGREYGLSVSLANYAWHSEHHLAHVRIALG